MTSICGLITIVDRGKSAAVQRIYQAHHVSASLVLRGHGTANSEIMDMLGLDEPQKEVLLSVTHRSACADIFDDLRGQLHFDKPGTGIAFTCALSGISVAASEQLPAEAENKEKEGKAMEQKQKDALWAQYTKQTHRLGRVLSLITVALLLGAPFVIGALLGAYPDLGATARGFLSVGLVWTVSSVADLFIRNG